MRTKPYFQGVRSISEILRRRAVENFADVALRFQSDSSSEVQAVTYGELDRRSRAIGRWLQASGAKGRPVILFFSPGLDYVAALFGAFYAGAIAVPLAPPRRNDRSGHLTPVLVDVGCHVILTTSRLHDQVAVAIKPLAQQPIIGILDDVPQGAEAGWSEAAATRDSLALLQYTSGSTATPKGVKILHGNLLHNISVMAGVSQLDETSVGVSWLPHFHDMGLVGGILMPICVGFPVLLMSPRSFLARPLRWLEAISRYGATVSGAPNFAYDVCVRKIAGEERSNLDLSNWRIAYCGSEPIRPDTIARFADAFASTGFRRESFFPCYGLAEATLLVSGGPAGEAADTRLLTRAGLAAGHVIKASEQTPDTVEIASSGSLIAEQNVAIVDPEKKKPCAGGQIGEIWVAGESVGAGYWNRAEDSEVAFGASLAESEPGLFLRTGDLGFVSDGKLFVTGRRKDLIVVRGLNHYPQDIELTVERSHGALGSGRCAAFSVDVGGEESLVIEVEIDPALIAQSDAIFENIVQAVARHHELQVYAIALAKRGSIPQTTSGKIQRQRCKADFLAGKLTVFRPWRAEAAAWALPANAASESESEPAGTDYATSIEAVLIAELANLLGIERHRIDPDQSIYALGLDSLKTAQLLRRVELKLGVNLDLVELFACSTIREVTTHIAVQLRSPQRHEAANAIRRAMERVEQLPEHEVAAILEAEKRTSRTGMSG